MERTPVISSNLAAVSYDSDNQLLEVEFNNGSVYQYSNVPEEEHEQLMGADSKGIYFNANIKDNYAWVRL